MCLDVSIVCHSCARRHIVDEYNLKCVMSGGGDSRSQHQSSESARRGAWADSEAGTSKIR